MSRGTRKKSLLWRSGPSVSMQSNDRWRKRGVGSGGLKKREETDGRRATSNYSPDHHLIEITTTCVYLEGSLNIRYKLDLSLSNILKNDVPRLTLLDRDRARLPEYLIHQARHRVSTKHDQQYKTVSYTTLSSNQS